MRKSSRRSSGKPARWGLAPQSSRPDREQGYLAAIAVITVVLWQTYWGSLLLYPFTILATWFHEMGHGLTAAALGGDFVQLVIFPNGSGFAEFATPGGLSNRAQAIIAAAGLLGPSFAGSLLIIASRSRIATRLSLGILGLLLIVSTVIWVRSLAGWIVLPAFAGLTLLTAAYGRRRLQRFVVELIGVQAAISVWQHLGYLFSDGGNIGGQYLSSDTGAISDALFFPYWFWGGLITVVIVGMVTGALRLASCR